MAYMVKVLAKMVFTDVEPVIASIKAMGTRRGQIFMDSAESEKLSAGFYFGSQLMTANHNFLNNYFALLYVINGEGWFRDHEGTRHVLRPGVMMIRHPGKTHSMERESGDAWLEFACAVPTSLYQALTKAGIIDSGRATAEMKVARQSFKNSHTTNTASKAPS